MDTQKPKKRKSISRPKKEPKTPKWLIPSDHCINNVLPLHDLIDNITHFLHASDIVSLSIVCKLYQELLPNKYFKRFVTLENNDYEILKHHFLSLNLPIPYKSIAFSLCSGRCVVCQKRQYLFGFDHLPKFYTCRSCASSTQWLISICKTTVESKYFLTQKKLLKNQIHLRSFKVVNPYYKSASEMQLYWEIEVKYHAEKLFGGFEGFQNETEKREKKRQLIAEKRALTQKRFKKLIFANSFVMK